MIRQVMPEFHSKDHVIILCDSWYTKQNLVSIVDEYPNPDLIGNARSASVMYDLAYAVFFTANNIAYAALVALVTKNSKERVEMGSWRFIFAFSTVLIIQSVTVKFDLLRAAISI